MSKAIVRILLIGILVLASYSGLEAQTERKSIVGIQKSSQKAETVVAEQNRRNETFLIVWQTINDNYFDQSFNGLDWNKIKTEYAAKVNAAKTDGELHVLLQEMIDLLNRSHFAIIPPEVISEIAEAKAIAETADESDELGESDEEILNTYPTSDDVFGIGIEVRFFDRQVVITRVESGSAAEKAGLKTGNIIEKVGKFDLVKFINEVSRLSGYSKTVEQQLALGIVTWFFNSLSESSVELSLIDNEQRNRVVEIQRERLTGELVKLVPNLPEQFLRFESNSLSDKIGYIKFNFFTVSMIDHFCAAISELKDKQSIIIDLRGNIGGSYGALIGISGLVTDKYLPLGTEIGKSTREIRMIKPHKKNFKGKLVILVDGLSFSSAEMFAAAFQENNRAVIIGQQTAGQALPALTKSLPTGAIFLFPVANFKTPNGNLLEGIGVKPDFVVSLDRKSLVLGKDDQIDYALRILSEPNGVEKRPAFNSSVESLPPPPKRLTSRTVDSAVPAAKFTQGKEALKIIDAAVSAIGGEAAFRKISSITAKGSSKISEGGAEIVGNVSVYRKSPNKWAEAINIEGIGDITEVFDGQKYFMQSKVFGLDDNVNLARDKDYALFAAFNELIRLRELYPSISYKGKFDRFGLDAHLIEAKTDKGELVVFVFDVETKFLVNRTGKHLSDSFDDYRQVGEVLFPFWQSRTDAIIYKFTNVKFNENIDDAVFRKAENCFDKID